MELVEQNRRDCSLAFNPSQGAADTKPESDLEDFERDELLRTLRL